MSALDPSKMIARHFPAEASRLRRLRMDQSGLTLVELVVAMAMTLVLTLAAIAFLQFTSNDVTRVNAEVHTDQRARAALTELVLQLHSGCVLPKYQPIRAGSSETQLNFVSGTGEGPQPEHIAYHELIWEAEARGGAYALVEHSRKASLVNGTVVVSSETPNRQIIASHLMRSWANAQHTETLPIFRFYRYYEPGDVGYIPGTIDPQPLPVPLTPESAEKVSKVTIAFSVAPEGAEAKLAQRNTKLEPLELEDSAVYRITPASTAATPAPAPCE